MITTKERAKLRAIANKEQAILQVGKGGIAGPLVKQVDDALTAREIIKMSVLETSPVGTREVAQELANITSSDIVQVIGSKFVLYRKNKKDPKIQL